MRDYQRTYLRSLKEIVALNARLEAPPPDAEALLARMRARDAGFHAMAAENTATLRCALFPVLDDIVTAGEEEIAHLEEFAQALSGVGADQPDLVLQYTIRCALLTHARKWGKRDLLIRQLYGAGLALFYMQEIVGRSGKFRYRWQMALLFGEAASYIKHYDSISDPEIRGYIHRSMGNLSLAYGGPTMEDAQRKLQAVRRSLQVLTDPVYQAKTPSLPWDRYIYVSHQERSSALNVLRAGVSDPLLLREVMESAQYVREHQQADCEKRGVKPMVRWRMGYEAAQYHCGILPLGDLLRWLEETYLERDEGDYTEDGVYHNISIPALYAEYLSQSPEYRLNKKEVLSHMYRRVVQYVRRAPEHAASELLMKYLLAFLQRFVEYPDGLQAKDALLQLLVCRYPEAYVFARLTAWLTRRMAEKALEDAPELLLGVLDCAGTEELQARREAVLAFAYDSGLLHNVGELAFRNQVLRTGRSWLEEEREMYHYHVYVGESLLARSPSTRPYAPTALGHHRYYDGSGGYPAEYLPSSNPNRAVTEFVGAAAHLIRLTGEAGPLNERQLTPAQALAQIQAAAGVRFSPGGAALLAALEPELTRRLPVERLAACREILCLLDIV